MWYSVHAFLYFKFKDGVQDEYFGWETVYLIEAADFEEASIKGKARAKEDEGDSEGTLKSNDRPATLEFAGLLKIVSCEDLDLDTEKPTNGTELTYQPLTLPTKEQFEAFVAGHSATIQYYGFHDGSTEACS